MNKQQQQTAETLNADFYPYKCDISQQFINYAYYVPHYDIYIKDDTIIIKSFFYDFIVNNDLIGKGMMTIKRALLEHGYLIESYDYDDLDGFIVYKNHEVLTVPNSIDLLTDDEKLKIWG